MRSQDPEVPLVEEVKIFNFAIIEKYFSQISDSPPDDPVYHGLYPRTVANVL